MNDEHGNRISEMQVNINPAQICTGNTALDTVGSRGWLVGAFVDQATGGLRHSNDVEIKWDTHKAGDARDEWVTGEFRTAITILISGKCEIEFRDQTVLLASPGDYVMWGKGTDHKWRIPEDAVIITVRWPSVVMAQ